MASASIGHSDVRGSDIQLICVSTISNGRIHLNTSLLWPGKPTPTIYPDFTEVQMIGPSQMQINISSQTRFLTPNLYVFLSWWCPRIFPTAPITCSLSKAGRRAWLRFTVGHTDNQIPDVFSCKKVNPVEIRYYFIWIYQYIIYIYTFYA